MKTHGQILYEYKNPTKHLVTHNNGVREYVLQHVPDWLCLTKECKQRWETNAIGHYLFSKERGMT